MFTRLITIANQQEQKETYGKYKGIEPVEFKVGDILITENGEEEIIGIEDSGDNKLFFNF